MKTILILFFLGVSLSAFSQDDFDKRLLVKFSEEQIADLQKNHVDILTYWSYCLDNSYEVVDMNAGKNLEMYPEINFKSAEKFNVLEINEKRQKVGKTHFRIKNSNQLLVLDSGDELVKKYNAYRGNN